MTSVGTTRRALKLSVGGSTAATLVAYACNLLLVPVLLHRIGIDLYGAWATIATLLAVGGLADAGVRTEIIRRVGAANGSRNAEEMGASVHRGVSVLAALASALAIAGAAGAPYMRAFAFPDGIAGYGPSEIEWLIRATFAVLAVELIANGYFAVLPGLQRADAESLAITAALPVGLVTTVAGVAAGWGLWALLAGGVAQLCVQLAIQTIVARRLVPHLRFRFTRVDRMTARGFAVLGGLALVSQIGDVVDTQWDKVVLARYVGTAAVASFQIGTSLVLQAKVLALIPVAPLLVAAAELGGGDPVRLRELGRRLGQLGAIAGASILGGVFVFAPAFLHLWLGADATTDATDACRIFTVAVAVNLWCAPLALRALGQSWHRLTAASALANMVVNGIASLLLTFAAGFRGPVIGSVIGNVVGGAVLIVLLRRRLGTEWERPPLLPWIGVAALALLATALGLDELSSWPVLAIGGALWLGLSAPLAARACGFRIASIRPIGGV